MKKLYIVRKNPVSHYCCITAVKPTEFSGTQPEYPDETTIVEVELGAFESILGKTIAFGEVMELECSDEQFKEIFND